MEGTAAHNLFSVSETLPQTFAEKFSYQLLRLTPFGIQLWQGSEKDGMVLVKTVLREEEERGNFFQRLVTKFSVGKRSRKTLAYCQSVIKEFRECLELSQGPVIFSGLAEELRLFKYLLKNEYYAQNRLLTSMMEIPFDSLHQKCLRIAKTCQKRRLIALDTQLSY